MMNMIESGAKGSIVNVVQIAGLLGQQEVEDAKMRVPYGFDDRTLPHFRKYEDSMSARGFVDKSFVKGLTPTQYFFHAIAAREGLIDTSCKTSDVGYLQRKLVKAMEDCKIMFDMTVRNISNTIVQFSYGGDGFDSTRLYPQPLPTMKMDVDQVNEQYTITPAAFKASMTPAAFKGVASARAEQYVQQVQQDRLWFAKNVAGGKLDNNRVFFVVSFPAVLKYAHSTCNGGKRFRSDLTPDAIFDAIERLGELKITRLSAPSKMLQTLLRAYLNPKSIIVDYGFTAKGLKCIEKRVTDAFFKGIAHPSELVGILAAQSIGEPATQMTLNTFHYSGQGGITKVVSQGVPRLKELLSASSHIKTPIMDIRVDPSISGDASSVNMLLNEIEVTRLRDIVTETSVYYDPSDAMTGVGEDKKFIDAWHQFEQDTSCVDTGAYSPWLIRFEFNKLLMLDMGLTMYDVYYTLTASFTELSRCLYSDDNFEKLIMRVRVADNKTKDVFNDLKAMEQSLLDEVIIKGMVNGKKEVRRVVKHVNEFVNVIDEDSGMFVTKKEFVLSTDGSNMIDVLGHPLVDDVHTVCNDVDEMKSVLGIEATRTTLLRELKKTLDGLYVQDRHLELLADVITCKGTTMPIDRFGLNRGDIGGPLAKCSFEESAEMLIKAGIFAEFDKMNGVSANVMVGQIPACGTGDSKILLDFEKLSSVTAMDRTTTSFMSSTAQCSRGLEMLMYNFDSHGHVFI
jgi:DNA-directed RNA polymerase II subunit RPB1